MIFNLLKHIFGTRNDRLLKSYRKVVQKINALEAGIQALSDEALKAKTAEFKQRFTQGETLEQLLPEAFAVVREASRRTLSMRHFDVQLIGGMVLNDGKITEMRTGEGKTLTATLAVYLNALTGRGVHIVTINDYLAKRDAEWMQPAYHFLGLTIGVNIPNMSQRDKQVAYAADVTYGTNNEFGFDYLRDNMVFRAEERVQRDLHFAIVDEVDSILIDEARTPLIISGQMEESSEMYAAINQLIPQLKRQLIEENPKEVVEIPEDQRGDYTIDEKNKQAYLTEQGHQTIEELLQKSGLLKEGVSLYDPSQIVLMHYVNACLRAHALYHHDVDYIVKDGKVVIVDEHTGRLMDGRRWSDGLHQAVEAKEGVAVELENQTLASITFQNYFRLYEKLSGMTGTADTEAFEFQKIYGLEVVVVPTNQAMIRDDASDNIYLTEQDKYKAILDDIKACCAKGQPVLVGTASIENSERLSKLLTKEKIPHQVLNAKQHEREAHIIEQAGRPATVTIATNMAGRGTDIVLGGNLEAELASLQNPTAERLEAAKEEWQARHDAVLKAGGLHVLGTERHESRRIDNQLRGRSGRQGDPGSSRFYLSMEDNLMRIFGGDRMKNMMIKLGVKENEVISHPWITRAVRNAQKRVEGFNFDIRKQLLEFDDVANDQRKVIYSQRQALLEVSDVSEPIQTMRVEAIEKMVQQFVPAGTLEEEWDVPGLEKQLHDDFHLRLSVQQWLDQDPNLNDENLSERIIQTLSEKMSEKEVQLGPQTMRVLEKNLMLQILDTQWREHLSAMDHLRKGIHLRGYAQKNPTQEFKRESFNMFTAMLDRIKYDIVTALARVQVATPEQMATLQAEQQKATSLQFDHAEFEALPSTQTGAVSSRPSTQLDEETEGVAVATFVREQPKVGRNDVCPCGSAKKYKQCCGRI